MTNKETDDCRKRIEEALTKFERHPDRAITCGEVSSLIRLALQIGDEQTVYAIKAISAVVIEGILKLNAKNEDAFRSVAQVVKGYIDSEVGGLKNLVKQIQSTTWN